MNRRACRLVGFLWLLSGICALSAADVTPVGVWCFDEAEGDVAADSSANGNDARLVNPASVQRVEGRRGLALSLSAGKPRRCGGAYVRKLKGYDPAQGVTLEARVKLKPGTPRKQYNYILSQGPNKGPGFWFGIAYDKLHFRTGDGTTTWGATSLSERHGGFERDRWYHVAATFDGSAYRLYIDGEEVMAVEEQRGLTVSPRGELAIGCYGSGVANHFNGIIDEARLYNGAKTPEEILKDARLR